MLEKDVEKRNGHIKGLLVIVILTIAIAGLPHLMFQTTGFDQETGCTTDGETCLDADNPIDEMIITGSNKGLLYWSIGTAAVGIIAGGWKAGQA